MSSWRELQAALDDAAERGEAIRVWWRDDDAGRDEPALDRLLDLAEEHGLPLSLAVVPAWLADRAQDRIAASSLASVLQHGFAHVDHAPPGAKSIELGGRDPAVIEGELAQGRAILVEAFGAVSLAVVVPPWNRIEREVALGLPALGFVGLSTFGPRPAPETVPGLALVNTHLDPIDWRGTRLFVGEAAALAQLVAALGAGEPVGILSHHLAMDEPGWVFLERLLALMARHPGARVCAIAELVEASP